MSTHIIILLFCMYYLYFKLRRAMHSNVYILNLDIYIYILGLYHHHLAIATIVSIS